MRPTNALNKWRFKPSLFVIIVTSLWVFIAVYLFFSFNSHRFIPLFFLLFSLLLLLLMPIYTIDTDEKIIVKRIVGKYVFPKQDYIIEKVESDILKSCIRTFASGGAFGYLGFFYCSKLGFFKIITINLKNREIVLLTNKRTKKKTIINYHFYPTNVSKDNI